MPYIGRSTDGFGVRNRFVYLASASDTSVSGADANGATLTFTDGAYVDVYLNGVLLKPTTDYNTSTANTIAGLSALNTNDEVTVVVYDVFTVADMVSATSGGTFSGAVTFGAGIKGGVVFNDDSADVDFRIESNNNANMINVDGGNDRVGIGISPSFNVQIDKSSTNTTLTDLTDAQLVLSNTGTATTNQHVKLGFRFQDGSVNGQAMIAAVRESSSARTSSLRFYSAPSSDGDPDERLSISGAGDVTVSTGNLVIGTSGKGIDFSAASGDAGGMSSEILDDYEEGTFTPVADGYSGTATFSTATYVKIGRQVTIAFKITGDGTSDSSTLAISGFPFAVLLEHPAALSYSTASNANLHATSNPIPNSMVNTAEIMYFYMPEGTGFTYNNLGTGYIRIACTYLTTA